MTERDLGLLQRKERILIEGSYATAADFRITAYFIKFPQSVTGLRMLDIGSGASTAVLELRKRGAKAFGIDPRYGGLDELTDSVERFITDPSYSARGENDARYEQLLAELQKEVPAGADARLWQMAVQMTRMGQNRTNESYIANQRKQLETFLSSQNEKPYVAGSAAFLPFRNRSFDFVYSLQAITQFLIEDRDVFIQSISEALRVLKTHGQLQLHPWNSDPKDAISPQAGRSTVALIRYLEQRRIPFQTEWITRFNQPRLVIYKRK